MAETIKLYYAEQGHGLPVLFIHGFPFDHTIWQAQAGALSEHFRIITPDLRGHGQSPSPDGVYHMDLLAQDMIALLDSLDIGRAVWVGHSVGGYSTMAALRLAPERIAGIALVATQPYADPEDRRAGRLAMAERALKEGSTFVAESMLKTIFAPDYDLQSPLARRIFDLMRHTPPPGVAGIQRGMAQRPDSTETLRGVHVPAVVIAGAADQLVALNVVRQMAQIIPQAGLVEIARAGHLPMIEQPEATTAALREFLAAQDRGRGRL